MSFDSVIAFDLETVPDLQAVGRIHGMDGADDEALRSALGEGFPKLPLHSIACIGALVARRDGDHWAVTALGAPHVGERSEAELLSGFLHKIDELGPRLVSFNGSGFDLPVLRYRAMVHSLPAPGLRPRYFNRYSDDAVDLCDVLSSFGASAKVKLDDLARTLGLPGKPDGMEGSQVAEYVRSGRIAEVAAYCESDVINTYRIWLRYELFQANLTQAGFAASEASLEHFIERRRHRTAP